MRSEPILPHHTGLRWLAYGVIAVLGTAFAAIVWALLDRSDTLVTRWVVAVLGDPARASELSSLYLMLTLPVGAVVVVFVRSVLGWSTFGVFTPMLLALAYLQSGPVVGPTISTAAILVGMASAPLLQLLNLSRIAYLGALIAVVVSALGALAVNFDDLAIISAFPVVVTALVVERWWNAWESEGPRKALMMTWTTHLIALVIHLLMASPLFIRLANMEPLAIPLVSVILMVLLGRYRGLRLTELSRFRAAKGA